MAYPPRLPSPFWKTALCGLAGALALAACEDRVAGTSVGTGNPTEIQVGFKDGAGPVALTGSLEVYASTQIPVAAFSPKPLLTIDVSGKSQAGFKAEAFQAIADSLWPDGSVSGGEYSFNVVVTGSVQGSIMRGFAYRKATGDFILRKEDSAAGRNKGIATISGILTPFAALECSLDTTIISARKDNFLFLYGTGFVAQGSNGKFVFAAIPTGSHQLNFISLPHKGDMGSGKNDSVFVYSVNAAAETGKPNPLAQETIQRTLPVPASLQAE